MGLFTKKEKLEAWNRLKTGKRAWGDKILAHTMKISGGNIRNWELISNEADVHKVVVGYRLVSRGVITTITQFNRVTEQILRGNTQ